MIVPGVVDGRQPQHAEPSRGALDLDHRAVGARREDEIGLEARARPDPRLGLGDLAQRHAPLPAAPPPRRTSPSGHRPPARPPSRPSRPSGWRTCPRRAAPPSSRRSGAPRPRARRPSRSAAICAKVVSCPCPCGDDPLRTSSRPFGSSSASAVSNSPPARSTYMPKPVPTTRSSSERRSGSHELHRQVQAARVVARVVGPAERRLVWQLADEVPAAELERVDPELARRDVDRALHEVGGLGPPGAAVGAGGDLVRALAHDLDVGGLDVVDAAHQHRGGVRRDRRGRHEVAAEVRPYAGAHARAWSRPRPARARRRPPCLAPGRRRRSSPPGPRPT